MSDTDLPTSIAQIIASSLRFEYLPEPGTMGMVGRFTGIEPAADAIVAAVEAASVLPNPNADDEIGLMVWRCMHVSSPSKSDPMAQRPPSREQVSANFMSLLTNLEQQHQAELAARPKAGDVLLDAVTALREAAVTAKKGAGAQVSWDDTLAQTDALLATIDSILDRRADALVHAVQPGMRAREIVDAARAFEAYLTGN